MDILRAETQDDAALMWRRFVGNDKGPRCERLGLAGFDNPETLWLQGLQSVHGFVFEKSVGKGSEGYRTLYDLPGVGGMKSDFHQRSHPDYIA